MKILHIGKFYPPYHGGMENYLFDLADSQVKQGHEVTVWVHNHQWRNIKSKTLTEVINGVTVIRQKSLKPILFTPLMLGFKKQLKQLIRDKQPDLIHLHWPNPSLFQLLTTRLAKPIPWVVSWHADMVTTNSSWLLNLVYKIIKPLETKLIKQSSQILVSSQTYADHSQQLQRFSKQVTVLPLGINTDSIAALNTNEVNTAWQANRFRLFHLGRLTFYKNQGLLIQAMQYLPAMQLKIAGKGQLSKALQKQVVALQLDNVDLLGAQRWQHVHALFSDCHVFCMASHDRAESFGVVLLEAMFHDKIILVPDTAGSGMQWLAENYHKGYVYESNNVQDFVAKVKMIEQQYDEISKRSGEFNYSIDAVAQRIQTLYQHILSGAKSE